jgi:hypothetical protein
MVNSRINFKGFLRGIAPTVMGLGLIALPTVCKAANNCPWINETTASGILGGDSVGVLTGGLDNGGTAVCEFTQQGDGFRRTLQIAVELAPDPHVRLGTVAQICGSDAVPLRAIGNEALICEADDRKSGQGERVVGRVRDQVFTITIKTTMKADPILTRMELKSRVTTAAEQVSGNLF